jgi:hypothetical protein
MARQVGLSIGGKPSGLKRPQRTHELSFPDALELGELRLIEEDLKSAIGSLSTLHAQYPDDFNAPVDSPFCSALHRDAVIQFVACFGHKHGLDASDVYAGQTGALEYMQWLRDVRDTFIGHTFGPMRQYSIAAAPGNKVRPNELYHAIMIFSTPQFRADIAQLATFMEIARRAVAAKVADAQKKVNAKLKAMSPAEVRALPLSKMAAPAPDQLRMTRKQFRAASPGTPPPSRRGSKS